MGDLGNGLFMLHPYRPGHVPVVLVHGTASSPARWAELVNELENDPQIWERYQIWLFIYNTGNPVALSGGLLRAEGIPARLVTGYRIAERNPFGDYAIVRERHAHAWTEDRKSVV